MLHLILADVKAGRSVLVIDPKADLVQDILERIPERRTQDVVVIDPSEDHPVGWNPLRLPSNASPTLIADALLAVLQQIFQEYWGIRTQDILSAALLTLVQTKGASLLWLPALLTDEVFRRKVTSTIQDPIGLTPFWEHFEAMNDRERRAEIAPVLNKLRQLTFRRGLRNILGQARPKFALSDLFHQPRILLVPLNKGQIGAETARLLGSLIVGLTWTLALSRADILPEKRQMVSVFIDELQDYIALPTDLSDALAQARGLGVAMTMAHQYRSQLPPDLRAGIDTNARNKIVFGLSYADAKEMAPMAPELEVLDFMGLPRYQIYTSIQSGKQSTGWMSGTTLPPPPSIRTAQQLKEESASRYGRPAAEVEAELVRLLQLEQETNPPESNSPIGRRKRL